jgi:phosphatidate cytidylyltransferase
LFRRDDGVNRELVTRFVSAVVLAPIVLALACFGGPLATIAVGALGLIVLDEWNGLARNKVRDRQFYLAAVVVVLGAVALLLGERSMAVGMLAVALFAALILPESLGDRTWLARGVAYALGLLVPMILLSSSVSHGREAVFFLLFTVWATDTFAYFTGRFIGGPKLMPVVSPKKTWSGFFGGLVGGTGFGVGVMFAFGVPVSIWLVAAAFILSFVGQVGDLYESWVKRHFEAKDSGNLIPGHGGLMDRIDSLIAAGLVALAIGLFARGLSNPAAGLLGL